MIWLFENLKIFQTKVKNMDRNSLERMANLSEQSRLRAKIVTTTKRIGELDGALHDLDHRKFSEYYGCSASDTYEIYAKRVADCCGQTTGYRWWIPNEDGDKYKSSKYNPGYSHCVVVDYKRAQPTQQERDAFWVIHGKEMQVTKEPHTERWGN